MSSIRMSMLLTLTTLGTVGLAPAADNDWGAVTGRFVLDGDLPPIALAFKQGAPDIKDAEICAAKDFEKHDLLIDPKTKGIANIFVYMRTADQIHPDLKVSKKLVLDFDQKGCRFFPRALLVRTDQVVNVLSDDPIAHNTHTFPIKNQGENNLIPPNERQGIPLAKMKLSESLPFEVKCDFHSWMKAHFLVLNHPYADITKNDGTFRIEGLPKGEVEFRVWHERVGYIDRKFTVTIKGGATVDVGAVKVPLKRFNED
ncbi:MAG: hypothetical protein O3A00_22500 [Planctomycetota bacterium]|nr:hypothetical protein [Planctomycetota bacterium]